MDDEAPTATDPMTGEAEVAPPVDTRSFWQRLLGSIRPTASIETDKRTGKKVETVGISAGTDFY